MHEELEYKLEEVHDSATELCLPRSPKRLDPLASPVTFSRERDGSTSGWEV
jgi:hypothetical protein